MISKIRVYIVFYYRMQCGFRPYHDLLMLPATPADFLDTLKETYWDKQTETRFGDIPVIRYPFSFAELIKKIEQLLHP
jgi:hypothetical protein